MRWKKTEYCGWGRALWASGELARPERQSALLALVAVSPAPAIGQRRSYGDAALNDAGRAIDMTRLDRILGFDSETGVISVEAGVQIGDLARLFAPRGWLPPVIPGTGFATVGGCIANDVHGKNHHVVGSFGQHVVEMVLIQNNRKKTVTPTRPADLFRATVGGLGQTGIIVTAKIQMMPSKGDMMVLTERRMDGWDEFIAVLDSSRATYCVGWIDATAKGDNLGPVFWKKARLRLASRPPKANPARCLLTHRTGRCRRRLCACSTRLIFVACRQRAEPRSNRLPNRSFRWTKFTIGTGCTANADFTSFNA